ncbi:hypothetical protein [Georgenia subflava]|uniref:VOC family protein n=1 Tax=Georgenia subflava TaxID=1622177 RepID=A0A6N7EF12_9MICO|nr:hypothetical protein [Georgenia subflava]MPV36610.1 hypothetical protein [Georgenia subflava]
MVMVGGYRRGRSTTPTGPGTGRSDDNGGLGLVEIADHDGEWVELAAGSGRLALHAAGPESPPAGRTKLGIEVVGTDAYRSAAAAAGVRGEPITTDHGPASTVDVAGLPVVVDEAEPGVAGRGDAGMGEVTSETLSVVGLVYTPTPANHGAAAAALGWRPRVASDSGGWSDLTAHGILAFHEGELTDVDGAPACEVSLETGRLEPLLERASDAGLDARIIDESYGRTLRVTTPAGTELWVNETQQDLYGYHLTDPAAQAR